MTDPRNALAPTPTSVIATLDMRDATDARQAAADRAVNQLTLSRAADGELDIPELGRVHVNAQMKNGEVDVRITADRQETQELVSRATRTEIVIDAKSVSDSDRRPPREIRSARRAANDFSSSHQHSSKRRDPRRREFRRFLRKNKQILHARINSRARNRALRLSKKEHREKSS